MTKRRLTPSASAGSKDVSTQRAAAMAALSSQLTSEGMLPKAAQGLLQRQNSSSAPVSPRFQRPHAANTTASSQRAAAMAALSSVLTGTKPGPPVSNLGESGKLRLLGGACLWIFTWLRFA